MTYEFRLRESLRMLLNGIGFIFAVAVYLLAALRAAAALVYRGLVGLTVGSRCSCERVNVDVLLPDGTTREVVGCAAALEAYARAGQAHRRADAAYMHSSNVKTSVREMAEPKTVQEMFNAQDPEQPAHTQQPVINGRFRPGQPTR